MSTTYLSFYTSSVLEPELPDGAFVLGLDEHTGVIIDLDAERGRISLSTKALEPEPGDMLTDPQKVFDKAEEMAARYKQMLLEQAEEGEEPLSSMMV